MDNNHIRRCGPWRGAQALCLFNERSLLAHGELLHLLHGCSDIFTMAVACLIFSSTVRTSSHLLCGSMVPASSSTVTGHGAPLIPAASMTLPPSNKTWMAASRGRTVCVQHGTGGLWRRMAWGNCSSRWSRMPAIGQ